jgi:hypothetical protein
MTLMTTMALIGLVTATAGCGSDSDEPVATDTGAPTTVEPATTDTGGPITVEPATTDTGGPITVDQLIERSADTPIAVQGFLHADGNAARLCAAVLESYPPQCGEPAVELVGLDLASVAGTTTAEGITWKEGAVLNLARAADGRFDVVDVVAGFQVEVTLGIYSGVPDPAWTLTAAQANELSAALARLTRIEGPAPTGGLGYHGFTITSPDGTLVAYEGKVLSADSDPPYVLDDPDRTIERLLLDTARAHVTADEVQVVTDALDG